MYLIERKTDTKEVVGNHFSRVKDISEWTDNPGREAIEITEEEYNVINIQGLMKTDIINEEEVQTPRFIYDSELIAL